MFISVSQALALDSVVKSFEVAFRSFIVHTITEKYNSKTDLENALKNISVSNEVMYANKINAKITTLLRDIDKVYSLIQTCNTSFVNQSFQNDVPYVSQLIDFILIFFNSCFSNKHLTDGFSSVEDFHHACFTYYQIRNDLSHPASFPISEMDTYKVIFFIEQLTYTLDKNYFWYQSKVKISGLIDTFNTIKHKTKLRVSNLDSVQFVHSKLLCREEEIISLYNALLGNDKRKRLAGSVSLYGYGGVGKTAITLDFLFRILREKYDGIHDDIEFLLFFSSKEEYLSTENTTGDFYVGTIKAEFRSLQELNDLILHSLSIQSIEEIEREYKRGIIVIDNVESITPEEKNKIFDFIRSLPRSIQFILTSRNEEFCDEKIHVEEFRDNTIGTKFIDEYLENESIYLNLTESDKDIILSISKGNALIILQIINILALQKATLSSLSLSLDGLQNKNSEMIANFMYKNTFNEVMNTLEKKGLPAKQAIQIISLYDEPIELYSFSKLVNINVVHAEEMCSYFTQRLILNKEGEYYSLNEFAKRFIFIKMLPDKIELNRIKNKINEHKKRVHDTLQLLNSTIKANRKIHDILEDWQPRNYIDKIVIAELVRLYGKAISCTKKNDITCYEQCERELFEHALITSHPYIPFQQARILKIGNKFYRNDESRLKKIEDSFEMAIESIEYNHRYLMDNNSYPSLLMIFGIFLVKDRKDFSRAIRFFEMSIKLIDTLEKSKNWFSCASYLVEANEKMYAKTNNLEYKDQAIMYKNSICMNKKYIDFDISKNLVMQSYLSNCKK